MADVPLRASLTLVISARLEALAEALADGAWLWRPRPFATATPSWAEAAPEVAAFCLNLSDEALFALEDGAPLPSGAPPLLMIWVARLAVLTELPPLSASVTPGHAWMVPARKSAQIEHFASSLGRLEPKMVLDWCGGKGHLGRRLGERFGAPVTVLEREAAYAEEARALAQRAGVELDFAACDALSEAARTQVGALPEETLAVGLHACGVLGERLLELAAEHRWQHVAHSPCCLHKVLPGRAWEPRSSAGRAALTRCSLTLDHSALRLATSDEVVARPALREERRRENAYRLALDLLLQERSGQTRYTPLGTLPAHLKRADFLTFAQGAAAHLGLELPAFDPEAALSRGIERARAARRLGLVRSSFRRAIELFVVLDRAAYLSERGYIVDVGLFAERAITPRNTLIRARLC